MLRKGGMRPGDRLLLTKPIGTGTLFAAAMRRRAKARWIDGAIRTMLQTNREASGAVRRHAATACTDVTGFGVLGHLVEMTKASGVDARLALDAIPILDGAGETVAAGLLSSLQPHNVRLRRAVANVGSAASDARFPIVFDPQTAGGLLASVPGEDRGDVPRGAARARIPSTRRWSAWWSPAASGTLRSESARESGSEVRRRTGSDSSSDSRRK